MSAKPEKNFPPEYLGGFWTQTRTIAQWLKYLEDQVFTGTVAADVVQTAEADVRHTTRTLKFGAAQLMASSGWVHDATNPWLTLAASTLGVCWLEIPMANGQRIKAVRVVCKAAGGAASDISAQLDKVTSVAGSANPTSASLVAAVNSAANANIQTITLTPTADTLDADEVFSVRIGGANTAGAKNILRVEVDADRL